MAFRHKDLLGIATSRAAEIRLILDNAASFKEDSPGGPSRSSPPCAGRTVVTMFYEASTRTACPLRSPPSASAPTPST